MTNYSKKWCKSILKISMLYKCLVSGSQVCRYSVLPCFGLFGMNKRRTGYSQHCLSWLNRHRKKTNYNTDVRVAVKKHSITENMIWLTGAENTKTLPTYADTALPLHNSLSSFVFLFVHLSVSCFSKRTYVWVEDCVRRAVLEFHGEMARGTVNQAREWEGW